MKALRLPRRAFTADDSAHRENLRVLEDWAGVIRRNVPETGAGSDVVATSETRTTATYGDLTTVGPTVSVKTGESGMALVIVSARIKAGAAGAGGMAFEVTDPAASVVHGAVDADSAQTDDTASFDGTERTTLVTGLVANTLHTFTAKYVGNGTNASTFKARRVTVVPI